jgi:hypothetical protein
MLSFGARYLSSLTHVPSGTSRSIPSTGGDLAVPLDDAAAPDRVEAPVEWSRRASGITL